MNSIQSKGMMLILACSIVAGNAQAMSLGSLGSYLPSYDKVAQVQGFFGNLGTSALNLAETKRKELYESASANGSQLLANAKALKASAGQALSTAYENRAAFTSEAKQLIQDAGNFAWAVIKNNPKKSGVLAAIATLGLIREVYMGYKYVKGQNEHYAIRNQRATNPQSVNPAAAAPAEVQATSTPANQKELTKLIGEAVLNDFQRIDLIKTGLYCFPKSLEIAHRLSDSDHKTAIINALLAFYATIERKESEQEIRKAALEIYNAINTYNQILDQMIQQQ